MVKEWARLDWHPDRAQGECRSGVDFRGDNPVSANLRYIAAVLKRELRLILLLIGGAAALAAIATMMVAPRYTATTSLEIDDHSDAVLGDELETSTAETADRDVERFLYSQIEILRSRALALRVAASLDLYRDSQFFLAMNQAVPDPDLADRERRELVLRLLRKNLSVELPRSTRIARVQFSSTDPAMSASIANAFAREFIQARLERRIESATYARTFVAEQLGKARQQLEASEQQLNAYAREAGLVPVREAGRTEDGSPVASGMAAASLFHMNQATNEARAMRLEAQARWHAEAATPLLASRTVLANPTVQGLMTRRARLRTDFEVARARYLPDHPEIVKLQDDLTATEAELTATAREVRESIRADYLAAQASEGAHQRRLDRLQGETLREQDRAVRYNTLARDAEIARSLYDGLLQRNRQLNAAAGIATSNIAIIDRAEPPLTPSSPDLTRNVGLGLFAGLMVAIAVVYLRDRLDDRIRLPEELEGKLDLPLLGVLPKIEGLPFSQIATPNSPLDEACHSLRAALLLTANPGSPRVLAVSSARSGEGKTTTCHAIASAFAQTGTRVLLVDADLRCPAAHLAAGRANTRGLSDLLQTSDPLASAIVRCEDPAFDLLPAGPRPLSPPELLSSPRMAQLLEEASGMYDMVVLDGPPVLGLADAPLLAALADDVILVVAAGESRSVQVLAALRRLHSFDAALAGIVLTSFDPAAGTSHQWAYYGHDDSRHHGEEKRQLS